MSHMQRIVVAVGALVATSIVACGGGKPSKYPPRDEGCDVTIYPEAPLGRTDNIGPVSASCEESVSEADCQRTLKDEVCRLGGDVVWGVGDKPQKNGLRYEWHGRAAHTRAPKAQADAPKAGDAADAGS